MRPNDPRQRFRTDGMATVSAERLVVLLYERLVRDLDDASSALAAGQSEQAHHALVHAQQIVEELSYAVQPDVWEGGAGLLALYEFVHQRLVDANVQKTADVRRSSSAVAEARTVVSDLSQAWQEAYTTLQTVSAPEVA